jgi:hypothetical protein
MFRALPAAEYGATDDASLKALGGLARAMLGRRTSPPVDGPNAEESGIPAAYTYFGQFIDHDLTFDPASSLQRQNDPQALTDFRTPRFDLDSVYGRGPDDQPYLYEDGRIFLLGRPLQGAAANKAARDLPRSAPAAGFRRRAIIGDPRNDENVIVSQLHGLVLRFHNRLAQDNPTWTFERVQREVRNHYQWVVLYDFLPRIVSGQVLDRVLPNRSDAVDVTRTESLRVNLELYSWQVEPFMPLEFSAAAFRFGHSMVRPAYRLNERVGPIPVLAEDPSRTLVGFREFLPDWAIDWRLFIDLEPRSADGPARLQRAHQIDPLLSNALGNLPLSVAPAPPNALAERNLIRGWRLNLPSGQSVARAMGVDPREESELAIGGTPISALDPVFEGNCPLWVYVLAETSREIIDVPTTDGEPLKCPTLKLGDVGGRIVTETIAGLLCGDSQSFLSQQPLWKPSLASKGSFGLRELIGYVLS